MNTPLSIPNSETHVDVGGVPRSAGTVQFSEMSSSSKRVASSFNGADMIFKMESMPPALYEQVHAQYRSLFESVCVPQSKWHSDRLPFHWAVDPETNSRFMWVDKYAPNDQVLRYLLIYRGHGLLIQIAGDVMPIDLPVDLKPFLEDIRKTLRDAYRVHGVYGLVGSKSPIPELKFE